jgi:hypothetical protein
MSGSSAGGQYARVCEKGHEMIGFGARRRGPPRWAGGVAATILPVASMGVILQAGFWETGGVQELATGILAEVMFLIVAPTTWIFSIEFIEVSRLTAITLGALTSLPLWFLLGVTIADRSSTWQGWLRRYATTYGIWLAVNFILFALIGSLAG